jgi:hypothetical protein
MIYFVLESIDNVVKIGKTQEDKLMLRISGIQTGNHRELKLIGVCEGYTKKEKELHKLFNHLRIKGEWFRYEEDLREYVENNTTKYMNPKDKFPKTLEDSVKYLKNTGNLDTEIVDYIYKKYTYLKLIIDELGYEYIEKENYVHTNLKTKATRLFTPDQKDHIKKLLDTYIKPNTFYSVKQIYYFFDDVYKQLEIHIEPKGTDILKYYKGENKVKSIERKKVRGFFINE